MNKRFPGFIILLAAVVVLFAGCADPIMGTPVAYDSLTELSDAVGFDVLEPTSLPESYVKAGYFCMDGVVAEILYMSGENQIIYAMTQIKNIKSDVAEYDEVKETQIDGHNVRLTLKDGYVMLGVMEKDGFTYSIYTQAGLSEGEFELIAKGFGHTAADAAGVDTAGF